MLETSKDFLFIAIAICVVIFTFFVSWAIYYVVMILKRSHLMIKEISDLITSFKDKLNKLEELLETIQEKVKHSASYLPLIMKGVTELIDFIKRRKQEKESKKTKK